MAVTRSANKAFISETLAEELRLTRRDSNAVLDRVLDVLEAALLETGRVQLKGFGTFEVVWSPGRDYKHPLTGDKITVRGRRRVRFHPAEAMQSRVCDVVAQQKGTPAPLPSAQSG